MKFFNLLAPDFKTQLNLPLHFCTLAKDDFSAKAVVDTKLGRWIVEAGNKRGRFYFHGDEWVKFANKHELQQGGLLLFEHRGSFLFHASVFDTSACEKLDFQPSSEDENAKETGPSPVGRRCANPTFSRIMRDCSCWDEKEKKDLCCLYLPRKIWRTNNLQQKTEAVLRISGLETKEWNAKLAFYADHAYGNDRLLVRGGWYEFVSANKIRKGHKCEFEIIMDATEFGYSNEVIIINVTKGR